MKRSCNFSRQKSNELTDQHDVFYYMTCTSTLDKISIQARTWLFTTRIRSSTINKCGKILNHAFHHYYDFQGYSLIRTYLLSSAFILIRVGLFKPLAEASLHFTCFFTYSDLLLFLFAVSCISRDIYFHFPYIESLFFNISVYIESVHYNWSTCWPIWDLID